MSHFYYDSEVGKFIKRTTHLYDPDTIEEVGSFNDLTAIIGDDFSKVDFNDFDFKGIDISSLNLTNAKIPTVIQKELGIFDDTFYKANITAAGNEDLSLNKKQLATLEHECAAVQIYEPKSNVKRPYYLFYITDLHLDNKLIEQFPEPVATWEIRAYIRKLISKMKIDTNEDSDDFSTILPKFLLIGGDVSHHYGIVKTFYHELRKKFGNYTTLSILGNHELWDSPNLKSITDPSKRLDTVIDDYEKMFDEYNLAFVHNMLYSLHDRTFVRGSELLAASNEEIREYCISKRSLILGGIGFSGKSEAYNQAIGLYKDTIISRYQEIEQSKLFEKIYNKLMDAIPDLTLIVFTHMPMECWTDQKPNPNWVYIHGHTHHNRLVEDNGALVYGDNQIGYKKKTFSLKSIRLDWSYDIFVDMADGIHEISNNQYLQFYRGQNLQCTCNRKGTYYLIKKGGIRLFILKNDSGNLMILDGGQIKKLVNQNLDYYYNNLESYAEAVIEYISEYKQKLKEISDFVKTLGGAGTIHGSIIDITFFDHLFLNPFDGSVIPYHAWDMVEKTVYSDLERLLKERHPQMLETYKALMGEQPAALAIQTSDRNLKNKGSVEYRDTWMYKCSRIFRKMQYLSDVNIIRIWNDRIMVNKQSKNAMIFEMLGINGLMLR